MCYWSKQWKAATRCFEDAGQKEEVTAAFAALTISLRSCGCASKEASQDGAKFMDKTDSLIQSSRSSYTLGALQAKDMLVIVYSTLALSSKFGI